MHLVYSTFFYLKKHMYVKIVLIQMNYKCNFKKKSDFVLVVGGCLKHSACFLLLQILRLQKHSFERLIYQLISAQDKIRLPPLTQNKIQIFSVTTEVSLLLKYCLLLKILQLHKYLLLAIEGILVGYAHLFKKVSTNPSIKHENTNRSSTHVFLKKKSIHKHNCLQQAVILSF